MIDAWSFYLLAVPAVLAAGISKGGFGGGAAFLAVPMLALVISPTMAAAIMLPLLCAMDLLGLWRYRGRWHMPNMRIMVPAALLGIAIGSLSFEYLNADAIRLLLGLISISFTLHGLFSGHLSAGGTVRAQGIVLSRGIFWSSIAGFTSFIAHAGGPPLNIYLLPQRLDRTAFVGTTVVFFAIVNYVKLVPYALLGQFGGDVLGTASALMPLAAAGMAAGFWLHTRVSDLWFYRVCYALIFVAGSKLILDGTTALIS